MSNLRGKNLPYTQEELDQAVSVVWKSKSGKYMLTVCVENTGLIQGKNWQFIESLADLVCIELKYEAEHLVYFNQLEEEYPFAVIKSNRWLGNERRSPERRIRTERRKT